MVMAIDRLAQHRHAVITLARRSAKNAVKRQLQAQGVRLHDVTAKDIAIWAESWFDAHRDELIAEAKNVIATSPLFVRWQAHRSPLHGSYEWFSVQGVLQS
jgi:hypothetical protein